MKRLDESVLALKQLTPDEIMMRLPKLNLLLLLTLLSAISAPFLPGEMTQFAGMQVVAQTTEVQKVGTEAERLLNLCREHLSKEQFETAIQSCQQAVTASQQIQDRSGEAQAMANLGIAYGLSGQSEQAISTLETALKRSQEANERQVEAITRFWLGIGYLSSGQSQKGSEFLQQALTLAQEINDAELETRIRQILAKVEKSSIAPPKAEADQLLQQGIQQFQSSQYPVAIDSFQKALTLYREIGDPTKQAVVLNFLASIYLVQGQHEAVIELSKQALAIAQETKNRDVEAWTLSILGSGYLVQGQYKLAIEFLQQALVIAQERGNREIEAMTLSLLGAAYIDLGQYQQAIAFSQQALTIAQETNNQEAKALALTVLGGANIFLGQYQQAIEFLQQSLTISQETGNRLFKGIAMAYLSSAYLSLGKYQQAIELSQQALIIIQETGNPLARALALTSLGGAYLSLGKYQQAIEVSQQALKIAQETNNPIVRALALTSLGGAYLSLGQYQQVIEVSQQALKIAQETGSRPVAAIALANLGGAYFFQGEYQQVIEVSQQALKIAQETGIRPVAAIALANLGAAYLSLGQYQQAIDFSQQGLAIAQEIDDSRAKAFNLANLGSSYLILGKYQQALEFLQQGLETSQEIDNRPVAALVLVSLGFAYRAVEQNQRGTESFQQALAIAQEMGDRQVKARALLGLSLVNLAQEQYPQEIESLEQALEIFREIGDRQREAGTLVFLGIAYAEQAQYKKATEFLQQSLFISRNIGSRELEGLAFRLIAKVLAEQNQPELAIVFYKQSVNITEAIRGDIRELPQELQLSYTETVASSYRALADLLLQQDRVLEAQQVLDLLKVQELDDYLRGVRGTAQQLAILRPEQAILDKYNEKQKTAAQLGSELAQLRKIPETSRTQTQQQRIEKLVQLQIDFNRQFSDFLENSKEIQALLDQLRRNTQGESLNLKALDRLRNNLTQLNAAILYPFILEDSLELVITTPNSPPLRRSIPLKRTELNQTIVQFRQALQHPTSNAKVPAQQLYNWLIKPLETDLKEANVQTIIYAPDGQLRYIPLSALYDGKQWLVERYRINNITATSIEELTAQPPTQAQVLAGAFADEKVSYRVNMGNRDANFKGLHFAGKEVETLSVLFPNTRKFLDRDFSLAAFKPRMNEYNIVHFATHAAFVPGTPENSFILFGNGDRAILKGITSQGVESIENWSLQNVDLVVLSACETGTGGNYGDGVEILGLGYQFQNRGAKAVIASLWPVSDGGTQVLMNAFYSTLSQNPTSKAEALRQAQIALITGNYQALGQERGGLLVKYIATNVPPSVRNNLSHPYYWAAFFLIGNGL